MTTRDLKNEMRFDVRFGRHLGKSASETLDKIKTAYKEDFLSDSTIFWWHKAFPEGHESAELISPTGRPVSASNKVNVNTISAPTQKYQYEFPQGTPININHYAKAFKRSRIHVGRK